MLIVSEQQTFIKLRLAPADFVKMLDENPDQALEYIKLLQGEREKEVTKKAKKAADPNKTPITGRGRKTPGLDLDQLE